jgi:hypothetical protein
MDVTNSTGESTDYRVTAKPGGVPMAPHKPKVGQLGPGEAHELSMSSGQAWTTEFIIGGQVVASAVVNRPSAKVALAKKNGAYIAEIT